MTHRSLKRACTEAYGRGKQVAVAYKTLTERIAELGIERKNIRMTRGNPASRDFPHRHVIVNALVKQEGKSVTWRRLRLTENLMALEDHTWVDNSKPGRHFLYGRGCDPRQDVGYE